MEITMREQHLRVMKIAIAERAEALRNPGKPSKRAFRVATVVCAVELGDTKALEFWINRVRDNITTDPIGEDEAIIQAAEYILAKWKEVERVHGRGALTNYRHRLNHSPAKHIGLVEIENAKRFQATRPYEITNRTWALEYC